MLQLSSWSPAITTKPQELSLIHIWLAADLVAAGYAVLVVDMRGHGETGGAQDWTLAADDLGRVWDAFAALETVDESRTAVVGASIGANMALRLGADRADVGAVALLSPGLDYRGVTTCLLYTSPGGRPSGRASLPRGAATVVYDPLLRERPHAKALSG